MKELFYAFLLSFIGTVGFAIFFNAPKNSLLISGFSGAFGWIVYMILNQNGNGAVFSNFIAAIAVSVLGEVFARASKNPVTTFVIPSIIPLVPGYGLYLTMLFLVQGDYAKGVEKGVETFFIAGAIAVGLIIVSSTVKSLKTMHIHSK